MARKKDSRNGGWHTINRLSLSFFVVVVLGLWLSFSLALTGRSFLVVCIGLLLLSFPWTLAIVYIFTQTSGWWITRRTRVLPFYVPFLSLPFFFLVLFSFFLFLFLFLFHPSLFVMWTNHSHRRIPSSDFFLCFFIFLYERLFSSC